MTSATSSLLPDVHISHPRCEIVSEMVAFTLTATKCSSTAGGGATEPRLKELFSRECIRDRSYKRSAAQYGEKSKELRIVQPKLSHYVKSFAAFQWNCLSYSVHLKSLEN